MTAVRNALGVIAASAAAVALALVTPTPAQAASALVLQDSTPLRAAPKDSAPLLTPLWRGEALEVRGVKGDWLQVWDHGRERGGFVRAPALLAIPEGEAALPELLAQLRLVRQQPGSEALGLGLAATLIERADPDWLAGPEGAEMLDALVQLQDRLAERVNNAGPQQQTSSAAHAEVAKRYGYPLRSLALADGTQRLCPNEEPPRLLRAHPAAGAAAQARAALALTNPACIPADLPAAQQLALHTQRSAWLEGIPLTDLPPTLRNRLLLRRAGVWSSLAFAERARDMRPAALMALEAWSQLIPAELGEDDAAALREAALRLAQPALRPPGAAPASRWPRRDLCAPARPCERPGRGTRPATLQPRRHPLGQRPPEPRRPQPGPGRATARRLDRAVAPRRRRQPASAAAQRQRPGPGRGRVRRLCGPADAGGSRGHQPRGQEPAPL